MPALTTCKWNDNVKVLNVLIYYKRVLRLEEFQELVVVSFATVKVLPAAVPRCASWLPPTVERFKLNTDAALMSSKETAGLGVVVRDSLWFVLLAAVKPVVGDFSPEVAESMAVFFGLQVAMESEFKDLEVETDAANVVHLVKGTSVPLK
ncbi:hypothetical protein ACOSQ3_009223 [Xanthoceras sorbifolium]